VRAQPEGIRRNTERKIDMQAKCAEIAARDAVIYVEELGVPTPQEFIAF
jgi:hypothetical protein